MGRKFTSNRKKQIIPFTTRKYPKYPVGSNGWHKEKELTMMRRENKERQAGSACLRQVIRNS